MKPLATIVGMSDAYRLLSSLREARRVALWLASVAALGSTLAGCSFSIPSLTAKSAPGETTGSIAPAPAARKLFPDLGPEEDRRARAALAVALDPQGNGKPVKWDNPESGIAGEVAASGAPFVEADEICRAFTTSFEPAAGARKRAEGMACRVSADDWVLRRLEP
jgi:surface antigen